MNTQRFLTTQAGTLATNAMRSASLDGREHLVVPVVALVAGVVNGYLVTPAELRAYADAWNGRPVPVRHPRDGSGYVSANTPGTIEAQVVGQFFNARIDGDKLVGELWVDIDKCERLGGEYLAVLERLRSGEPIEVSTAYFCDVEQATGTYNGKAYTAVQRNLRPDHLALLPDEEGACSWKDGCGAPRVNQAIDNCSCKENESMADETNGTKHDEAPGEGTEKQATAPVTNEGDGAAPEQEQAPKEQAGAPADEQTEEQAPAADGGLAELAQLVAELGGAGKVAEALRSITANAAEQRAQLVSALTANAACAFGAEDLQRMTLDQLVKLDRSLRPAHYGARPASNTASVPEGGFVYSGVTYRPYVAPGAEKKQ